MDPLPQLVTIGGAAGALFYVLKLLVDGKLHTQSEVDGLAGDKQQLFAAVGRLSSGLERSNKLLEKVLARQDPGNPLVEDRAPEGTRSER